MSQPKLFEKVLIANRGEIACRIIRTCKELGIKTVSVYSDVDKHSNHVLQSDEAYYIGKSESTESYLNQQKIIDVALHSKAQAIHPGYGFLSENATFVEKLNNIPEKPITFIGPPINAINAMGSKSASKTIMMDAGVPLLPGWHSENENKIKQDKNELFEKANKIGYPLLIKAVLGGGGKGMRTVFKKEDFFDKLKACQREALGAFNDDRVLLEAFIVKPRHVEVQVFADQYNNTIHLYERDCTLQRRHQKILEESPAPLLNDDIRNDLGQAAVKAAQAVGYVGAGTVEFLMDKETSKFYFCEMNTRLQVEHPVTEYVTGVDLVKWQLLVASNFELPLKQHEIKRKGHAIEARIYAEDVSKGFLPSIGKLNLLKEPHKDENLRIDTGVKENDEISMYYDPMIAKMIAFGDDRQHAIRRLTNALQNYMISGVETNIQFLINSLSHDKFINYDITTNLLDTNLNEFLTPVYDTDMTTLTHNNIEIPKKSYQSICIGACMYILQEMYSYNVNETPTTTGNSPFSMDDMPFWRLYGHVNQQVKLEDGENVYTVYVHIDKHNGMHAYIHKVNDTIIHPHLPPNTYTTHETLSKEPFTYTYIQYNSNEYNNNNNNGYMKLNLLLNNNKKINTSIYVNNKGYNMGGSVNVWSDSLLEDEPIPSKTFYKYDIPKLDFIYDTTGETEEHIKAPMPGKIIDILINEGDVVAKNTPCMILEAMKMEHVIYTPKEGQWSIHHNVNDIVSDGDVLLSIIQQQEN